MPDTEAWRFLPDAFAEAAWTDAPNVSAMRRPDEPTLAALRAESELRDFVHRYANTLDRGDIDGVMDFFTSDCVMITQRGTFSGTAELRAEFERMVRDAPRRLHHLTNVSVRLADDLETAYVSCYVTAILESLSGATHSVCGLIVVQVVGGAGQWKIQQRWVSIDATTSMSN